MDMYDEFDRLWEASQLPPSPEEMEAQKKADEEEHAKYVADSRKLLAELPDDVILQIRKSWENGLAGTDPEGGKSALQIYQWGMLVSVRDRQDKLLKMIASRTEQDITQSHCSVCGSDYDAHSHLFDGERYIKLVPSKRVSCWKVDPCYNA